MKDSPVLKLQGMAGSSSIDISELLSFAKMISVKLDQANMYEWLDCELNGYPDKVKLPDYRVLKDTPIKALNHYRGEWTSFDLSEIQSSDPEFYETITTVYIGNSISMLMEFVKSGEKTLYCELPESMKLCLQEAADIDFLLAWRNSPAQIINIFAQVKSKILNWSLSLEKNNILGEGLLFSTEERKEAIKMTVNNINNFNGNITNSGTIGAGNSGDIHQKNMVVAGDFSSLERQLGDYGVDGNDIVDLKNIIDTSPKPTSGSNFGEKIGGWIGNIIGKAYSGSLKITGAAAPVLLTNALCHYFGIPV